MRYDNVDFIGKPDSGYAVLLVNNDTSAAPKPFDEAVERLVKRAAAAAVQPGNGLLGRAEAQFDPTNENIYGLAQCTRDLQPLACSQCLATALEALPGYCQSRVGCQINYSSCTIRYETYPFYSPAY